MRRASVVAVAGMLFAMLPLASSNAVTVGTIVYGDYFGGSGLHTASPDMTSRTHITGTRGALDPAWSPDGSGFAYIQGAIKWSDADGSNQHVLIGTRVFPGAHKEFLSFDWSPDGTQMVVSMRNRTDGQDGTFVVTVATRETTRLMRGGEWVSWSSTDLIVVSRNWNLVTVNPDGSGATTILGNGSNVAPSWSPNGSEIVFQRTAGPDNYDINVVNADGSGRANLTKSPQVDWAPTWSPDGSQIMWSRSSSIDTFADMFVMQADGSGQIRLTTTDKVDEYQPDWTA